MLFAVKKNEKNSVKCKKQMGGGGGGGARNKTAKNICFGPPKKNNVPVFHM